MRTIRVGTRGSNLALWQATYIRQSLEKFNSGVLFEQIIIKTEGDRDQQSSLSQIGGQGVFTKEIEKALLDNKIDIAVHSLKDLPSKMPEELILGAVPERGPVEDILITETGLSLRQLPEKTRVATGSIRRKSQLLHLRPDLITSDLRGNIDTRLNKLKEQDIDAIIMAKAAIIRLNLGDVKYSSFKIDEMIPAVGQGTIGLQIRKDDLEIQKVLNTINHYNTYQAIVAERELLYTLDSGCQFPVGAFACIEKGRLKIKGFVGSEDGKDVLIESFDSEPENAVFAGQTTAQKLIDRGALSLLKSMY